MRSSKLIRQGLALYEAECLLEPDAASTERSVEIVESEYNRLIQFVKSEPDRERLYHTQNVHIGLYAPTLLAVLISLGFSMGIFGTGWFSILVVAFIAIPLLGAFGLSLYISILRIKKHRILQKNLESLYTLSAALMLTSPDWTPTHVSVDDISSVRRSSQISKY